MFQGLVILLMGSMSWGRSSSGSNDVGDRCHWVVISLEGSGVGVGEVIMVAWVQVI